MSDPAGPCPRCGEPRVWVDLVTIRCERCAHDPVVIMEWVRSHPRELTDEELEEYRGS